MHNYFSKRSISSKQNSYQVVFALLRAKVCFYLSSLLLTNWLNDKQYEITSTRESPLKTYLLMKE